MGQEINKPMNSLFLNKIYMLKYIFQDRMALHYLFVLTQVVNRNRDVNNFLVPELSGTYEY